MQSKLGVTQLKGGFACTLNFISVAIACRYSIPASDAFSSFSMDTEYRSDMVGNPLVRVPQSKEQLSRIKNLSHPMRKDKRKQKTTKPQQSEPLGTS